jgi:hypothetical protein
MQDLWQSSDLLNSVVSILIAIGAVLVLDQELLWAIPTAASIGMCHHSDSRTWTFVILNHIRGCFNRFIHAQSRQSCAT